MRPNPKQSEQEQKFPGIRSGVWLSMLGVTLLGLFALSLSRKETITDLAKESAGVADLPQPTLFKHSIKLIASSSHRHTDEIDAMDLSILNDRNHWVDSARLP